ncbi:hypothetical protein [Pseudomonas sp. H9]|uniref:hypothetical protein n=1 Tax=Pseudomonas sp. H9 TaxID=483968 RepID=UPI001057A6BE|nr:hypothetical protein [Pseudomonas sp. H9]TDF78541.1 hypothetical protein E1573_22820 [Pseudomonas sp. H9]
MAKTCIFCGEKPSNKTKEHVIPQWLIELTGNPNREAFLGFIKHHEDGFKDRKYAFDQFTFPACDTCNNKYAELEGNVKPILLKVLNEEPVLTENISTLLDWLDKVRIGLWLGMNQLDKNYANVDPNYHINTRIGQYDRMLIVEKSNSTNSKLNLGGIDTLSFALTPSVFVLIVNNIYITNISFMFLLSRRLGFPYPTNMHLEPDHERVRCTFVKGRERIMSPLLRKPLKEKGTFIFQPMFRGGLIEGLDDDYKTEYVKKHSLDFEQGIGNIFQSNENNLTEYTKGETINLTPHHTHNDRELFVKSAIHVCEWQNWLTQFIPNTDKLTPIQKKFIKSRFSTGVKVNNLLIKHHKSLL